ncbi:hypothetical protein DMENIID0001_011790 [Sergentomyia squamirostris]
MEQKYIRELVLNELKEKAVAEQCDAEYLVKIFNHHMFNHEILGVPYFEHVIKVYKLIAPAAKQTEDYLKLVPYIATIFDMVISLLIVIDDILDQSEMRSGKLCWHKIVGVEAAANDSHIMMGCVFYLLKKHFSHLDCYTNLLELVHESLFTISLGQHFDDKMSREDFDNFTEKNYKIMIRNKTSYSLYFSLGALMYLAGYSNPETHKKAKEFFFELGYMFQVQNDFWDCYEHMNLSSKSNTDIVEGKLTWLAVQCLKIATVNQKELFFQHYGKKMEESEVKIKELYDQLNMQKLSKRSDGLTSGQNQQHRE